MGAPRPERAMRLADSEAYNRSLVPYDVIYRQRAQLIRKRGTYRDSVPWPNRQNHKQVCDRTSAQVTHRTSGSSRLYIPQGRFPPSTRRAPREIEGAIQHLSMGGVSEPRPRPLPKAGSGHLKRGESSEYCDRHERCACRQGQVEKPRNVARGI